MILEIHNCHVHYGKSHIFQGVTLQANDDELITLFGRNGADKTTTLKCIAGVIATTEGDIRFCGQSTLGFATHAISRNGVCLVPQHGGIFQAANR